MRSSIRIFQPVEKSDQETQNLINFLQLNCLELCEKRENHIDRIKDLKEKFPTEHEFIDYLKTYPKELSFISALEVELDRDLSDLLPK